MCQKINELQITSPSTHLTAPEIGESGYLMISRIAGKIRREFVLLRKPSPLQRLDMLERGTYKDTWDKESDTWKILLQEFTEE